MIKPPCLPAMRYRSLLYHKSHLVNRNLHCYCFVLFSERGWGQRLKTSRILGPGGSYTATPILLTYGQVCPGYAIYPQSALPPQQVLINHDEGTYCWVSGEKPGCPIDTSWRKHVGQSVVLHSPRPQPFFTWQRDSVCIFEDEGEQYLTS